MLISDQYAEGFAFFPKLKTGFYRDPRTAECVSCACDASGSVNPRCDSSGRCSCRPGVTGHKCDRCLPNHFGFSAQGRIFWVFFHITPSPRICMYKSRDFPLFFIGCQPCSCDERGSVNNNPSCDVVTGKCRCKANVEGDRCDRCKPGFFNLQTSNDFGSDRQLV